MSSSSTLVWNNVVGLHDVATAENVDAWSRQRTAEKNSAKREAMEEKKREKKRKAEDEEAGDPRLAALLWELEPDKVPHVLASVVP